MSRRLFFSGLLTYEEANQMAVEVRAFRPTNDPRSIRFRNQNPVAHLKGLTMSSKKPTNNPPPVACPTGPNHISDPGKKQLCSLLRGFRLLANYTQLNVSFQIYYVA